MKKFSFTEIVDETKEIVLSAIEKNLADRFYLYIDDVVQETYLRAYKSLKKGGFEERSKLSTWLFTIARNESRRMNERLLREESKFKKSISKFEIIDNSEEKLESSMTIDSLYDSIEELPEKYSVVMTLVAQGNNQREIASKLDIKVGTVKSRISRGREQLHSIMVGGDYGQ